MIFLFFSLSRSNESHATIRESKQTESTDASIRRSCAWCEPLASSVFPGFVRALPSGGLPLRLSFSSASPSSRLSYFFLHLFTFCSRILTLSFIFSPSSHISPVFPYNSSPSSISYQYSLILLTFYRLSRFSSISVISAVSPDCPSISSAPSPLSSASSSYPSIFVRQEMKSSIFYHFE